MTEVDKLKWLLEEAREFVRPLSQPCIAPTCIACDLTARIDAALAEPVTGNCLRCWALNEMRVSDQRKNDEAQTELRSAYAELQEARAALADAYRRGAEAMRGASITALGSSLGCTHARCWSCPSPAETIHTLPLPEDK
jgi:hypothetical protein